MLLRRFRKSPQKSRRSKIFKRTVCRNLADNHGFWDKLYLWTLGEADRARSHLKQAIAMDDSYLESAREDRDLAGIGEL